MFNPVSTYRIQFNKEFTFSEFLKHIEYLFDLGISSLYASPVFEATPGSMHGYDVTNPLMINPQIGTEEELAKISEKLKIQGMGWLQDVVPNHMAFHNQNAWLMDVLEKGRESEFADFFDIDFSHPEYHGKIMVPFLGKTLDEALEAGEVVSEIMEGRLVFRYFDFWLPVNNNTLPQSADADFVKMINSDKKLARNLLDRQNYTLCYWKDSLTKLNYRRFFTVNSLICLSMERDEVFDKYHSFINKLVAEKKFNGLRIDHVDGLQKPLKYLDRLRLMAGEDTYTVTEKILGLEEELPVRLPIQGTSGYDYLGIVNNLFTHTSNYKRLEEFYKELTGIHDDPEEIVYSRKKSILTGSMNGEWENLTRMFEESAFVTWSHEITRESMKDAIGEFLVLFPVYKIYGDSFPLPAEETDIINKVFRKAALKNPHLGKALSVLQDVFLNHENRDEAGREKALGIFLRCLQFTGPLMAKGVEDTVMYYYNCFICHNEVGDHSSSPGISIEKYHELMISRQRNWPMSMNATSTHDTKRGEDVRARLNVISELPGEWMSNVREWMRINSEFRNQVKGKQAPDFNEEYFIYQTLIGALPFDKKAGESFTGRMSEYLEKALREAKTNSDWNDPDKEYESAVKDFTLKILRNDSAFMKSFLPFQKKIAAFGVINSLSQLMLKAASPGIPDFYQGTELWDLSLVDPDNRRPVDYTLRQRILSDLKKAFKKDPEKMLKDLVKNREDGRLKLWMTNILLKERKVDPGLFLHGSYIPLETEGKYAGHVLAFARVHNSKWFIVIVPLFIASIDEAINEPSNIRWGDTSIILPELAPTKWTQSFAGKEVQSDERILLSDIMKFPIPVFLKGGNEAPVRSAGVLAHISSLPGKYGTGDLGPEAYDFADLLQKNGHTCWQILPFNPVGEGFAWSPYSSTSAFAGNTMFINPDLLVRSGLLHGESLKNTVFRESSESEFQKANDFRSVISDDAFTNFFCNDRPNQHSAFEKFCRQQEFWLYDYALFNILRREHENAPWNEWPKKYRNRIDSSLAEFAEKFGSDLKKEMFMQYLFNIQWLDLKRYCNNKGIKIIGDMSFYVNFDSAEVWAHPENFNLTIEKKPLTVAGVPPDYFSETGQLWNMPIYAWDRMERDGYSWWLNRIRRNMELCDILRFDHFRAFSEYWEIPFGEKTAIKGKWTPGPGKKFFDIVRKEYPDMPFIAEDLGSIDEKVYRLRDDFGLPGMTILQFAFGDNTPRSGYIPHNFIQNCVVYTGTHDNNTTRGWYVNELDDLRRREASEYAGHEISGETCHEDFIRMAYGSVARIAIIPVQDLLGLDESARFNTPSTSENNWRWKMKKGDIEKIFSPKITKLVKLYGRI